MKSVWTALGGLPRTVWLFGLVSLLTDAASDMVYPLLPKLIGTVGGGAVVLGIMEGIAELVSAGLKVWSGARADRTDRPAFAKGEMRDVAGSLVVAGYGLAAVSRPLLCLATSPFHVVLGRTLDRTGKGLRSAPRDAILGRVVDETRRGLAFGVHRAMDNLGAVFGALFGFLLLAVAKLPLRTVIALSIIPGLLSTALAWYATRSARQSAKQFTNRSDESASQELHESAKEADALEGARAPQIQGQRHSSAQPTKVAIGAGARGLLIATAVFGLGASADSFLIARLGDLGLSLAWLPLAWISLQLAKSILNIPGGMLADWLGPKRVLVASFIVYAVAYAAFARVDSALATWAIFPLYALHYGLGEGAEKSLMAKLCPDAARGRAFGLQHAVHGMMLLPANVAFGVLYMTRPQVAFAVSGTLALVAAIVLVLLVPAGSVKPSALRSEG